MAETELHPLFRDNTDDEIWALLKGTYTPNYIRNLRSGYFSITAKFRRNASRILDTPESTLFVGEETHE